MFSFLELTDGAVSTAVELTDMVRFALVSYAPGVAPQRDSLLGGAGVYDDVVDTITFHAIGATATEAYANAGAVNALLDQARAWWHGEQVSPVLIRATVQDSVLGPLSAIVIGRQPGGPPPLALQAVFDEHYGAYLIKAITIQFIRGDQWYGVAQTATSNSAAMPNLLTATFAAGAVDVQTPSVLTLSGPLQRSVLALQLGYLLIAPQNRIEIVSAQTLGNIGTGTATPTADAANHPINGSIQRLAGAPAAVRLFSGLLSAGFRANAYQVAVFATVRVNGPGAPASPITMQMKMYRYSQPVAGPSVDISYAYFGTNFIPQPVFLGMVESDIPLRQVEIDVTWSDAATTIDVDQVVLIALNNAPDARVIATVIDPQLYTPLNGINNASGVSVTYDPRALTKPAATVYGTLANAGESEAWSVVGDPFLVSKQAVMTGMWLSTQGAFWRPWDTTSAAAISFTLAWSRNVPYLVPE